MSHHSQNCMKTQRMTLEQKREKVKAKKCCFSCLGYGHLSNACKVAVSCSNCNGKHVPVMCSKDGVVMKPFKGDAVMSGLNCSKYWDFESNVGESVGGIRISEENGLIRVKSKL